MKKILTIILVCVITSTWAQKQYNCYYVQEFKWNPKTSLNDIEVKQNTITSFKIDEQKKTLTQVFEDSSFTSVPVTSQDYNKESGIIVYKTVSPTNGYVYLYRVHSKDLVLEVIQDQNGVSTLLKKYLYK